MKTFDREFTINGIGVHSGATVTMTVRPSETVGIDFQRSDLPDPAIPATYDRVGATFLRNTTIGDIRGACVQTIEHVMAALCIMGIDGAHFLVDGPETPILDGSAAEFCRIFLDKIVEKPGKTKKIIIKKEIVARPLSEVPNPNNDSFVRLYPDQRGLNISARLVYSEKIIGDQSYSFLFDGTKKTRKRFLKDIARARTFGKLEEWEQLKTMGMGRGCSEENVIVIAPGNESVANVHPYGLRWSDEFVRHKIIDIIGDMFTAGGHVVGGVESYKGSHALNNAALKKLFESQDNYDILGG